MTMLEVPPSDMPYTASHEVPPEDLPHPDVLESLRGPAGQPSPRANRIAQENGFDPERIQKSYDKIVNTPNQIDKQAFYNHGFSGLRSLRLQENPDAVAYPIESSAVTPSGAAGTFLERLGNTGLRTARAVGVVGPHGLFSDPAEDVEAASQVQQQADRAANPKSAFAGDLAGTVADPALSKVAGPLVGRMIKPIVGETGSIAGAIAQRSGEKFLHAVTGATAEGAIANPILTTVSNTLEGRPTTGEDLQDAAVQGAIGGPIFKGLHEEAGGRVPEEKPRNAYGRPAQAVPPSDMPINPADYRADAASFGPNNQAGRITPEQGNAEQPPAQEISRIPQSQTPADAPIPQKPTELDEGVAERVRLTPQENARRSELKKADDVAGKPRDWGEDGEVIEEHPYLTSGERLELDDLNTKREEGGVKPTDAYLAKVRGWLANHGYGLHEHLSAGGASRYLTVHEEGQSARHRGHFQIRISNHESGQGYAERPKGEAAVDIRIGKFGDPLELGRQLQDAFEQAAESLDIPTIGAEKSPVPNEVPPDDLPQGPGAANPKGKGDGAGKKISPGPVESEREGSSGGIGQRGLSEGPPGPLQIGSIAKAAGLSLKNLSTDILGALRHLRERFSPVEARYGSGITKDFIKAVAAPSPEARTIVSDFANRAFGDAPDPSKAFQDFTDLGRYYRLRNIQQRMPGQNVGAGLPPLSAADVTRIESDPYVKKGIAIYNKEIAPKLTDIRQRNGMILNPGAGNPAKFPFFLNLPGEFEGPAGTDTSVNPSLAFNKPATGNSQLLMDPKESLEAAVRGHLSTDYKQNLVKNLKGNFSVPQTNVVQKGKGFTANFKGRETDVVPVDLAAKGQPEDVHYIPSQLAHEYNNIRQDRGIYDTLFDKAIQAGTKAAVIGDFSPHAARVIAHVAARQAQAGQNLSGLLPSWLGSNEAAAARMYEMSQVPHGKVMQLLIDRSGSDKGAGFDVKPGRTRIQQFLAKPHDILFDPDHGVDPMGRRVVADAHLRTLFGNDYVDSVEKSVNAGQTTPIDAADALEKKMSDAQFVGLGRKVNGTLGFANKQTRSGLLNWASRVFPFISSESGMIPREISKVANLDLSGLKSSVNRSAWKQAALQLGGALATGAVGTYIASNALNYANTKAQTGTGRFMWDNDDGHKLDIWIAPGWHLSNLDPTFARGTRLLGIKGATNGEGWQKSAAMEAINEPLSMMAKTLQVAWTAATAATGSPTSPHFIKDDRTGKIGPIPTTLTQGIGVPLAKNTVKEYQAGRPIGPGIIKDVANTVAGANLTHDNKTPDTPAQKAIRDLSYHSDVPLTPEQKSKSDLHRSAAQLVRDGKIDEAEKAITDANATKSDVTAIKERARYPDDMAYSLSRLTKDQARQVMTKMTPAERAKYRDVLLKKLGEDAVP